MEYNTTYCGPMVPYGVSNCLDLAADVQCNGGQLQHGPSGTGGHHGPVMLGRHGQNYCR